jgi:RNase P/RNase MRP subunit p29
MTNKPTSHDLVRGVLGGWVIGKVKIINSHKTRDGGVTGSVVIQISPETVHYETECRNAVQINKGKE